MQRILSTYLFVNHKLTPGFLGEIANAGFAGVEIFCSRGHFDYRSPQEVREIASALAGNHLTLHSLHAPTSRDLGPAREGGAPLSICAIERVHRLDAMDEIKYALDVAEQIPFRFLVQHMGGPRETFDPRKRDSALSSLEHLSLFAGHRGVTIALENTTSEMGEPAALRSFVEEARLPSLRFCFDLGHANLSDAPAEERLARSHEPMRERVATTHIHDNHGDKDEHLPPYEGSIDWAAAAKLLTGAAGADLPLVLELKEQTGAGTEGGNAAVTLAGARAALDKLEKTMRGAR